MKIELSDDAKRDLKKIPKSEGKKISRKLMFLEAFPYSGKKLGGELADEYSVRAWPYRVIYRIYPKDQVVFILVIEHRQGVYK